MVIQTITSLKQVRKQPKADGFPTEPKALALIHKLVQKSICAIILGKRGAGKSALGQELLRYHYELTDRPCFVYNFPRPDLLPAWITNITEKDYIPPYSVLLVDEASVVGFNQFDFHKKKTIDLVNFIRVMRHCDVSVILVTQQSIQLTRDLRRLTDVYFLKQPNLSQMYDEAGIIKKLYSECINDFNSIKDVYMVWDGDKQMIQTNLPCFWTDQLSKAFGHYKRDIKINVSELIKPKEDKKQ